jgi:hypothetical protein
MSDGRRKEYCRLSFQIRHHSHIIHQWFQRSQRLQQFVLLANACNSAGILPGGYSSVPARTSVTGWSWTRAPSPRVLREGTNGFTRNLGHPAVVGGQAYCANEAAMQWERDFAAHKPKPTNTEPGIEYMLLGRTD